MEAFFAILLVCVGLASVVLGAVGLSLIGLLQYRLAALLSSQARVNVVLLIVAAGALLSIGLSVRNLDDARRDAANFIRYEDLASAFTASRWLTLALVGVTLIEGIGGYLRAHGRPGSDPASPLLCAMLAFYLGTLLIQSTASLHPTFPYKDLYLPIVLVGVFYQRIERPREVLTGAKSALLMLTLGSLVAAVIAPNFVLHRPDPGLLPGIDWRLYGLTAHANTIGPAALLAIVLELYSPSRIKSLRALNLSAASAVLLLAQSRTAWAAAIALVVCIGVPLALRPAKDPRQVSISYRRAIWTVVACLAIGVALALLLFEFGAAETIASKLELTTLNGRLQIWDITLQAWRESPLFGYGAEVWGLERQWRFQMFHVGHAHNQIVQTLGDSGLSGLVLLLAYVAVLLRTALVTFKHSDGLVMALVVILLSRFVTEAPMRGEGPLSWSGFMHILIIVLGCHSLRASASTLRWQAAAAGPTPKVEDRLGASGRASLRTS